jgi:uroporphyrin-III C-methyltransferase/precorrin-2 dehydrogenase/sirohydrochlorin ferrochelatase/uroporphyrin-III C-methyltransferase
MTNNNKHIGKVILAGAGPGDPELITVKAQRAIQQAEVILTDRLVSEQIINDNASENAEIIHVGKQCRTGYSTPQQTINELMVHYAMLGKKVVRLKGGDVSIFSNILDELETLVNNNIPYEIIPGITAAMGAAAYAGIPLTARGYSTALRFLTYYKSDVVSDKYWKELAVTSDTLVFYMSIETLPVIVQKLIENYIGEEKAMAIIQQATTPMQHIKVIRIHDFVTEEYKELVSPTLVIIGDVVNLHQQFAWLNNNKNNLKTEYFKTIEQPVQDSRLIA